jgi:hypothetical protein
VVSDAVSGDETAPKKTEPKKKEPRATVDEISPDAAGRALLTSLQKGGQSDGGEGVDVFMTDAAITARSQKEKLVALEVDPLVEMKQKRQARAKETADSLQKWVQDLPQVPATTQFGDFRFDVDAIMNAMDFGVKSVKKINQLS